MTSRPVIASGLAALLTIAACSSDSGEDSPREAPVPEPDGTAAPTVAPAEECGACCVGVTRACTCADGSQGTESCVAAHGEWSQCGCYAAGIGPEGPVAALPPPPPLPVNCGGMDCPMFEQDTELAAQTCCTFENTCGASENFIFGLACVPMDLQEPVPPMDPGCPSEFPNFLDLIGCCTATGQCGLWFEGVETWSWGCIERSEMATLINAGSTARDAVAGIFSLPVEPAVFPSMPCSL